MTTSSIADRYAFREPTRNERFEEIGFGPFVVQRAAIIKEILTKANPKFSIHISGCRACGKTTMLDQIGLDLVSKGKTVYYFPGAEAFIDPYVRSFVDGLILSGTEACFLVDETQTNVNSEVFIRLLKNRDSHRITTIGAGVPKFETASGRFNYKITVDRLLLSSDQLESEGVIEYFTKKYATGIDEIKELLEDIRSYVGGHVYPLMWLAEQLVPRITKEGEKAKEVMKYFHSSSFQQEDDFKQMVVRILPSVAVDLRQLFIRNPDSTAFVNLIRNGICNKAGQIISQLLFFSVLREYDDPCVNFPHELNAGLDGVGQLFAFALPLISWDRYGPHAGPVEDALTLEVLFVLGRQPILHGTQVYHPKLVDAGTPGRMPDFYLNSTVDSYVECILTTGTNESERGRLDKHIARFYSESSQGVPPPHYQVGKSDFAILNYQKVGTVPLQPSDERFQGQVFAERVFTFLMATKEVYLGSNLIAGGTRKRSQVAGDSSMVTR